MDDLFDRGAAAFLHALHMELRSDKDLGRFLASIKSFTSDMGTEGGLPELIVEDLSSMLPEYLARAELEVGVDAGSESNNDADLLIDVDRNDDCESGLDCDVDQGTDDGNLSNDGGPHSDGAADRMDFTPGPFLVESLTVPGIQHIIDTVTKKMHTALANWDPFHSQLKNLELFLTFKEYRDRYIRTCIRGTAFANQEELFLSWGSTLYENRWHETVTFVRELTVILPS